MPQCQICQKSQSWGNNVSHSKRRTSRTYQPNVQTARVLLEGKRIKLRLCTRCPRTRSRD